MSTDVAYVSDPKTEHDLSAKSLATTLVQTAERRMDRARQARFATVIHK